MPKLLKILLLALALVAGKAVATAQESDSLALGEKQFALNTNPLSPYLRAIDWKPPEEASIWSSNWRGYIAHWTIEGGQLVLVDATIKVRLDSRKEETRSIKSTLFPGADRVVAEWYSGALIVPDGERVQYVHMGYASRYDHYQVFRVAKGEVIEHLSLTGEQFEAYRSDKFEAFTRTQEFKDAYEEMRADPDWDEESIMDFLRDFHSERYLSM